MKKYKLKLIQVSNGYYFMGKLATFPTLTLPMIAAATPDNYSIMLVDERVQENNLNDNPDIVGLSFECYRQKRAFEIAEHYRKRGIKVIFGGVHTTSDTKNILKHCDAAVIGEAEELWPKLLKDFEAGNLKRIYSQKSAVDLSKLPQPRVDLLDLKRHIWVYPVQASRGCSHSCKFCFSKIINPTYRTFPVDYVVEQVKRSTRKWLFFMDDNFTADRENAIKVLKALTPYKKKIGFQGNILIGKDIELLKIMKEAGCVGIFAGIESINTKSLASVDKGFNRVKDYGESIYNLKKYGIEPQLGLMFGFDYDTPEIFMDTYRFLKKNKVLSVSPNFIAPYPGTEQFESYDKQGRILSKDYRKYDGRHLIVRPKSMTPEELIEGYKLFMKKFHSPWMILERLIYNIFSPRKIIAPMIESIFYRLMKIKNRRSGRFDYARP